MTLSRRGLLRGAATATAAGLLTGCSSPRRAVQVAVVWSGQELAQFRRVLRGYSDPVEVVSARNDINAFLTARYRTANQPDVAILPQIGLLTEYARRQWLAPMRSGLADRFAPAWNELVSVDGVQYGAWVKAAHKSLLWYAPAAVPEPPRTWEELSATVRRLAGGRRAPLAVGAADGWVLTDWLENVLAATAGRDEYRGLVTGAVGWDSGTVRRALRLLAELWQVPGAFTVDGGRALLTQHEESVLQVAAEDRAAMVVEGDFVAAVAAPYRPPLATVAFPAVGDVHPLVAAGDAAVVLGDSAAGHDLVDWLTGPASFAPWSRDGGYLSPNLRVSLSDYPAGRTRDLADQLRSAPPTLRFDLSDQLPGTFGGPDGLGIWKVMQDFFGRVTVDRVGVDAAVTAACADLIRAADQARREVGG
jgi:ABC-type glycerol-3-phosphate transport system substrate-binding protein